MSAGDAMIRAIAADVAKAVIEEIRVQMEKPATVQKLLYTIAEAATALGCSKRALEQMIFERTIPTIRRGRRVYIHKKDLDEFIEQNRV